MSEHVYHERTTEKEPTLEELIYEDLEAEEDDHDKYIDLANQADHEYPTRGYGGILRDIAKEEGQHHKHLMDILHDIKFYNQE